MESKLLQRDGIISAMSIEQILEGDVCPFCGNKTQSLSTHFNECNDYLINSIVESQTGWAFHNVCGKVIVLNIIDGLCLFEGESGRYVSPASNFKFGSIGSVTSFIEDADLTDEEIDTVINMLRLKKKEFGAIPEYPTLWKGCEVELQAGNNIMKATIVKFINHGYLARLEDGLEISIQPKHIVRLI